MTSAATPIRTAKPLSEKLPPFDAGAEEAVLGSVLVDDTLLDRIADTLAPEDFYRDEHAWTYTACLALWRRGESVNQVTVAHELSRAGKLHDAGGLPLLARLTAELPTPIGAEHYAAIVRRDATYRALISVGQEFVRLAYDGGPDLDGVLTRCERSLRALSDARRSGAKVSSVSDLLDAFWDQEVVRNTASAQFAVQSGLRGLDALTAIAPGKLVVIAAGTGDGKSLLLMNIARHAAVVQNARTVIFTLEVDEDEWRQRLLARESDVDSRRLIMGQMTELEERKAMTATATLHPLALDVVDNVDIGLDAIKSVLRTRIAKRAGVDLVLVDYLQLVEPRERYRENRTQQVTEISRGLKKIAREFKVPVIAAAQLSREVNRRSNPQPQLSDLRESGSIEQDADIVLFLWRPDAARNEWRIDVAKNRAGPTGSTNIGIAYATGRCWDLAEQGEEEQGGML